MLNAQRHVFTFQWFCSPSIFDMLILLKYLVDWPPKAPSWSVDDSTKSGAAFSQTWSFESYKWNGTAISLASNWTMNKSGAWHECLSFRNVYLVGAKHFLPQKGSWWKLPLHAYLSFLPQRVLTRDKDPRIRKCIAKVKSSQCPAIQLSLDSMPKPTIENTGLSGPCASDTVNFVSMCECNVFSSSGTLKLQLENKRGTLDEDHVSFKV